MFLKAAELDSEKCSQKKLNQREKRVLKKAALERTKSSKEAEP